ncbi:helix-turn-helix domain-containing protein [Undibacterium sp. SXout7W]|uniref:helix-turn-helix domain-containing protein n=1 Tax=Undibacterium sp. SXout7W TaxID=3413049 RepID=UPI003BF36BE2
MLTYVIPPLPHLSDLIMHLLVVDLDDGVSLLPASLCPSLMLFVRGSAQIVNDDGSRTESHRFFLRGPFLSPTRVTYEPGTISLSVCLKPGMLQQTLGISAASVTGSSIRMDELISNEKTDALLHAIEEVNARYDGRISATHAHELSTLFQRFLLNNLHHKKNNHLGAAFLAARQKLFFPLADLSDYFGIGQRQLERRVRETFGVTLRDVRRIARFGLCLPLIVDQSLSWGDLTRVAHESGYYDQAHMHREFVELVGIPPMQLLQKIASSDPAYWIFRLSNTEFRQLFIPVE